MIDPCFAFFVKMWSQQERTFENFFYRDIYLLLTSCQLINQNPFTYELLVPILHQDTFVQAAEEYYKLGMMIDQYEKNYANRDWIRKLVQEGKSVFL